jgi:hypothetical protein
LVDNYDDYYDDYYVDSWWWLLLNCDLLNVWTCILDNAIVVEIVNVIGGALLHWWFVREEVYSYICYVEVVHYRGRCCMSMHHDHIESYVKCKRGGVLLHRWFVREEVFSYIWCSVGIMRWRPLLLVTVPHASRRV